MSMILRRAAAVIILLAGITLGFWVVFGSPHDWSGGMRLLKLALGLTSVCVITASTWLMFPGSPDESDEADASAAPVVGPLNAL
ncbi:hypothetical protein ACH4SP_40525 [Streptomyces sp. NPDC021093]|uniref:hypothetical protein n=1 Tax=Streptomyces sp. NPDC021093 TaxID=3365112 RepID=UPI00379A315B